MKKIAILLMMVCGFTLSAHAQYKPTQKDVGKDCTTQDGKLGTWKNVRVEDGASNQDVRSNSSSNSVSAGGNYGVANGNVSGSSSSSRSNTSSSSEKITYDDIRCVEDKNATLPQQSPVRW